MSVKISVSVVRCPKSFLESARADDLTIPQRFIAVGKSHIVRKTDDRLEGAQISLKRPLGSAVVSRTAGDSNLII